MKYILTTGCSFTNNLRLDPDNLNQEDDTRRSWPYYIQEELGDEYKVLNYGGATNDNVSMCRIQLYHIDRLIKEGVNPKDISIITQWSDPTRDAIYLHNQFSKEHHYLGHTLVYHNNWEERPGVFYLTGGFMPPDGPDSAMEHFGISNAIKYWELDINWNNTINQTMRWFELWNLLEIKCKELGIKTFYMCMRNAYSIEAKECYFGAPDNNSDIPTKKTWFDEFEVLKPYLDILPIDTPNHWHYKNYNGLLEWTLDYYKKHRTPNPYQESVGIEWEDYLKLQENEWGHPSPEMMEIFVKTELKPFVDELRN